MEGVRTNGTTSSGFALVLGGGAARGLAHIGVLEVLEREGLRPSLIVGTSMGGLIGALSAAGLRAAAIAAAAREFDFPWWYAFGQVVTWDRIFRSAARLLRGLRFEQLPTPLQLTAVGFESGRLEVLGHGPLLPAVRATCCIPGVEPPVAVDRQWMVDGGILNVLPVDVAWSAGATAVVAVNPGGLRARRLPQLHRRRSWWASRLGRFLPNPATARLSFELLVRASEIALAHQAMLSTAMANPDVLIEPALDDVGMRDFGRLDEAVAAGRRATEAALPRVRRALEKPHTAADAARQHHEATLTVARDPVCRMLVNPARAKASLAWHGEVLHFCSENCRERFELQPEQYDGQ